MINFYPTIRKIKIDKFLQREKANTPFTGYLEPLTKAPKHLAFDQLLLADLLHRDKSGTDSQSLDFYDQNTIQKLIQIQYPATKALHIGLLTIYILGFLLPFVITVLTNHLYKEELRKPGHGLLQFQQACLIVCAITLGFY